MLVKFDRTSVCMGDDCFTHNIDRELDDAMMVSALLEILDSYVPKMYNVVWVVLSSNYSRQIIGYIVTDNQGKSKFELTIMDKSINKLFDRELEHISVFCKYYHQSSFSLIDGITGEHIHKYNDCDTLLEKVKCEFRN